MLPKQGYIQAVQGLERVNLLEYLYVVPELEMCSVPVAHTVRTEMYLAYSDHLQVASPETPGYISSDSVAEGRGVEE